MSLSDLLEECARLDFDAVDPTGYFFSESAETLPLPRKEDEYDAYAGVSELLGELKRALAC